MEVILCKCCGEALEKFGDIYTCFNKECYNYKRSVNILDCEVSSIEKFIGIKKSLEKLLNVMNCDKNGDFFICKEAEDIVDKAKESLE